MSFSLSAVLVLEENFTVGCELVGLTELSLVQATKQTAMVKAVNVNLVKDFTFVFI